MTYSSSLINFGRTARKCSMAGIDVDVPILFGCSYEFDERKTTLFRSRLDSGMMNSVDVKLLTNKSIDMTYQSIRRSTVLSCVLRNVRQ
jgi:hypothetical protein